MLRFTLNYRVFNENGSDTIIELWLKFLLSLFSQRGTFFYRKSTMEKTIRAIEANNDTYCLQKTNRKVPLFSLPIPF